MSDGGFVDMSHMHDDDLGSDDGYGNLGSDDGFEDGFEDRSLGEMAECSVDDESDGFSDGGLGYLQQYVERPPELMATYGQMDQVSSRKDSPFYIKMNLAEYPEFSEIFPHIDYDVLSSKLYESSAVLYSPRIPQQGLGEQKAERLNPLALTLAYYIIKDDANTYGGTKANQKTLDQIINKDKLCEVQYALMGSNDGDRGLMPCKDGKCTGKGLFNVCIDYHGGKYCRYKQVTIAGVLRYVRLWQHLISVG